MHIQFSDRWGVPLQAADETSVSLFGDAVEDLVTLSGDPVTAADAAVASPGGPVLGHVLRAYLALYGASAEGLERAAVALEEAEQSADGFGEREVLHVRAARSWFDGDWVGASRWLERALLHEARDLLALRVAQDLHFFLGDRAGLLRVAEQVVPAWHPGEPGWGHVQGILAFGLEENARYREAETSARAALGSSPDDVWAVHALAHVFEMEGRPEDGVEFLRATEDHWSPSYFAVHNWWHRALYHLELGGIDDVLALYDGPIRAARSSEWLDVVDAAALLWRLSLFGIDVHERAMQLSGDIEPLIAEPVYVFNDWHAVMAFSLAGRHDLADRVIGSDRERARGTNRVRVDAAGLALLDGFALFGEGQFGRAFDRLADVHARAHIVGGSHAQRDVIDLTLLAAATRAGRTAEVEHLAAGRRVRKPSAAPAVGRLLASNAV
jgi:tetratricopeptide (TPR) repeat protein